MTQRRFLAFSTVFCKIDAMKNHTIDEIQSWLLKYVSRELDIEEAQIPVDEHLVNLGLSSRQAIALTAELESFTGRPTDPALAWEYPTINQLAQHLGAVPC